MKLRQQLILVSLLTLSLPWAGAQYVKEMEAALRYGQTMAITASAQAVADRISASEILNSAIQSSHPENVIKQRDHNQNNKSRHIALYAHPLPRPLSIDGYRDDWRAFSFSPQRFTPPHSAKNNGFKDDTKLIMDVTAGVSERDLYLFVEVKDEHLHYHHPGFDEIASGDHLLMRLGKAEHWRNYIIRTSAPGSANVMYKAGSRIVTEHRIKAHWQESEQGYQVEIKIPQHLAAGHLAISAYDSSNAQYVGNINSGSQAKPLPYVSIEPSLQQTADTFTHEGTRLRIISDQQWILADSGSVDNLTSSNTPKNMWTTWIYQLALGRQPFPEFDTQSDSGKLHSKAILSALNGKTSNQWYRHGIKNAVQVAVPIFNNLPDSNITNYNNNNTDNKIDTNINNNTHNVSEEIVGEVVGVVIAEQTSQEFLALTNSAFTRLFQYSLMALGICGIGLISYASWLSFRIRKLSQAAQSAVNGDGTINNTFSASAHQDEVGDLSRSYGVLLARLKEYTDYLRTLSSKLSHELRTPLAIVKTSLDNLQYESDPELQKKYVSRAQSGADRLSAILTAMSSANRLEETLKYTESELINLSQMLTDLSQAYASLYEAKQIIVTTDITLSHPDFHGAADLIVQALDKLVENAADFCPQQGKIILGVRKNKSFTIISVSNNGPLLPSNVNTQIFDSLVSLRNTESANSNSHTLSESEGHQTHLGLGLYIVRLIAEFHHGFAKAYNKSDESGVIFELHLREKKIE
ncbi:histidine kinase dimerization/phospho-acceptor domain-containing protein [Marinibactrum halimedae]|uniref:histidine kinase n=1 Tax=Marinibactrum halimedae TaxID=1444977 RepID=A0AA37T6R7_9GAMM|nr:histidine kinase dimerization/phospho-acceptor domain-containing protein [Marinibactrum halimedae]MCD9457601.1 ATP-binding protein [Marinibactrum halimedae]GLS28020.1 proteobacterial dedicated sortase system histidine kinase [Marinibactrum halimedae]